MSEAVTTTELTSEEISSLTRQTNYGTWRFQKTWKPLHITDAEGCWFIDGAGKRYLDFSSQLMCVNLGHKNLRVIEAIAEQARELAYVAPGYATSARAWVSHFVIAPPLIVTKEELDLGIACLDQHLSIADALVE
jgi:taurine--2-oxoglutarate transaminase